MSEKNIIEPDLPLLPEEVREGITVEFKSSIFFAPYTSNISQVEKIAQTLAAFMNTQGGTLYLGVTDTGRVCGIEGDLAALKANRPQTHVKGPYLDDRRYDYTDGNLDKLQLKLNAIVEAYLEKFALNYIKALEPHVVEGRCYCKVMVDWSKNNFIYFKARSSDADHFFSRTHGQNVELFGRDRERFAKQKIEDYYERQLHIYSQAANAAERERDESLKKLSEVLLRHDPLAVKRSMPESEPSKSVVCSEQGQNVCEEPVSGSPAVLDPDADKSAWFKKLDGTMTDPDTLMAPASQVSIAKAYLENRLRANHMMLYRYLQAMMKENLNQTDTFNFLHYIVQRYLKSKDGVYCNGN